MALDYISEDKIKKPDGTTFTRSGIGQESINYYKTAYQENLTEICDFSDGSEIRTLHESIAVEIFALYRELVTQAKMKFVKYATGTYLDELACEFHLTRKKSEVARGTVVFTTSATVNNTIIIPKGTVILARNTGYEYILAEDVPIIASDTPANGTVYSKLTGAKYNAPVDKLTAFRDIGTIRTEIKVTNPTEIVDGLDEESDEELRERILNSKREKAYGTATAYSNLLVEEVPDIHDVSFVEPELLITDEKYARHYKDSVTLEDTYQKNSDSKIVYDEENNPIPLSFDDLQPLLCTSCTNVLFINAHSKPCPDHVIDDAEYVMTQQNNLVIGQKFHIEKAQLIPICLSVELFVLANIDEEILFEHLQAYFNGGTVETKTGNTDYYGLNIGETLYKSRLIDAIEEIPGVFQVGSIKQAKFNKSIPTDILQWNNNGGAGYSYEDDEGYMYYRKNTDNTSIDYWGTKNFVNIETHEGSVFHLIQQKELDESTQKVIDIKQFFPDGKEV